MELVYRDRAEIIRRGLMENYILNCLKNYMVGEGVRGYALRAMWSGFYPGVILKNISQCILE